MKPSLKILDLKKPQGFKEGKMPAFKSRLKQPQNSIEQLLLMYENSKSKENSSVITGTLYKSRKVCLNLCKKRPLKNTDNEVFETYIHEGRANKYISLSLPRSSLTRKFISPVLDLDTIYLHRLIPALAGYETPPGIHWHHIDANSLNNRWDNLWPAYESVHADFHRRIDLERYASPHSRVQMPDLKPLDDLYVNVTFYDLSFIRSCYNPHSELNIERLIDLNLQPRKREKLLALLSAIASSGEQGMDFKDFEKVPKLQDISERYVRTLMSSLIEQGLLLSERNGRVRRLTLHPGINTRK